MITFPGAGTNGADLSELVTRPTGAAAVTKTYQLGVAVHPGRHLLRVDFLADTTSPSFTSPLATAKINVSVTNDGALRTLDGKSLGTIAYGSNVTSLAVAANQTVEVGGTSDILVVATTPNGFAALAPGSVTFALASGAGNLTLGTDGTVTGVAVGLATLTATVDGLTTPAQTVTVLAAPVVARTVALTTADMVPDAIRGKLWVTTTNGVASLDPASGALGATISLSAPPTALALSDDGTTLYAGLQSLGTVRRVDLTTGTAGTSFTLPNSSVGSATTALDIAVQPGSVSTLSVIRQDIGDGGFDGPVIIDDGVARPNALGTYDAARSLWTATDRIVAYPGNFGGFQDVAVDAQGATLTRNVSTSADLGFRLVLSGGRIYAANGIVADATTLASVGQFVNPNAGTSVYAGVAVDADRKRAYFVEIPGYGSPRLHVYDTDTFAAIADRRLAGITQSGSSFFGSAGIRLSLVGDRLAFRLDDQVVLVDNVSSL